MNQKNNFELLLVENKDSYWEVIGTTYSNALRIQPNCTTLNATYLTIQKCKKLLADGMKITISKNIEYPEVQIHDIIANAPSELEQYKNIAINDINAKLHQAIFAVNVIDLMDYLDSYMSLLNAGYFITDSNREDKYFEVIEAAQEIEEPEKLKYDASYDEEREYVEKKFKYDNAQANLKVLQRYLDVYDRLSLTKNIANFLVNTKNKILNASSKKEIDDTMNVYRSNLANWKVVN